MKNTQITYSEAAKNEERIFNASMMKERQETLEEAAEKYADFSNDFIPMSFSSTGKYNETSKRDFIAGSKWQAERMWSREEVAELIHKYRTETPNAKRKKFAEMWIKENLKK
jgi:hypothetical protein